MAKQKRKPANRKPITSHQLFPAVVALWFGALFGLGSLAVRPSLIESLVLSSRIDLVIPAAAPPLGVTARIMLALIMAAIGAIVGVVLARRLARPKVEPKERSRSARGIAQDSAPPRARDAHPDAPACKPISVSDLGDEQDDRSVQANVLAGRRRALTVEPEEEHFVPHDFAPLPGGAPQILETAAINRGPAMPAPAAPVAPFEPAQYAPLSAGQPAASAVPVMPAADPQRQVFQAQPIVPDVPITPDSVAAHADGRQVFGMEQPQPQPEKPRQIFGQTVEGDHVAPDFVRDAGYRITVFETEEATPLFDRSGGVAQVPTAQPVQTHEQLAVAAPVTDVSVPAAAAIPVAYAAPPMAEAIASEPVAEQAFAAPQQPSVPVTEPLPVEPLASPASLGITDLASRLADSMRRRRAAKAGASAEPATPAAPLPVAEQPQEPATAAPVQVPFAADPAPVMAAAPIPVAFEPAPAPIQAPVPTAFEPAAAQFSAPTPLEQPAVTSDPAPVAAPAMPQPFGLQAEAPEAGAFAAQAMTQPEPVAVADVVPDALRPLALDAFLEEDSAFAQSLLPPRMNAAPQPQDSFVAAPASPQPAELQLSSEDEHAEQAVDEANYGSLLGMAQPRGGFVRIEEPEADASAPEPVVIFPGQAPLARPAGVTQIPVSEPEDSGFRRFDGPEVAGHGQPVAPDAAAPAMEASAADQALRSALANLQRMSGAA